MQSGIVVSSLDLNHQTTLAIHDIALKEESKEPIISPIPAPVITKPSSKLIYLNKMDQEGFKKIIHKLPEKFHAMTPEEAEKLLTLNHTRFRCELYLDRIANGTNLVFVFFLINTGTIGFTHFLAVGSGNSVESISNNSSITDAARIIVPVTASIGVLMWFSMTSPWTSALVTTLRHATHKRDSCKQKWAQASQNRCSTLLNLSQSMLLYSTLQVIDFYAGVTEAITIAPLFDGASPSVKWLKWPTLTAIIYFSKRFCGHCWDDNAAKNLTDFWLNKKNHTSLAAQILQGNLTTPLKTFLEGVSAIGLKTLFYYFIAVEANKKLAWNIPPFPSIAFAFIHGLLINYPTAFENLIGPFETFDQILTEKIGLKCDQFFEEHLNATSHLDFAHQMQYLENLPVKTQHELVALDLNTPRYLTLSQDKHLAQQLNNLIKSLRQPEKKWEKKAFKKQVFKFNSTLIEKQLLTKRVRIQIFKKLSLEMLNVIFGAYAGVRLFLPPFSSLNPYVSIPLSATLGAFTAGTLFYKGAWNTALKKAACEEINGRAKNKENGVNKAAVILSFSLVLLSGFSDAMTTIDTAGNLIKEKDILMILLVFASIQQWLNGMRYNRTLVQDTLDSWIKSAPCYQKTVQDGLEHKTERSCCSQLGFWKSKKNDETLIADKKPIKTLPTLTSAPISSL